MKKKGLVLTNIIGFIVGTFIFGIAGVYAVTYFSSTNTTYDNSSSGMSSTNVQTAIDELYNVCKPPAGEQIIKDNNLKRDPYECRYFFTGAFPKNYIKFNNETWRIISIGCNNTIKIMRNASIGNRAWDSTGYNNWNRPATLNTYLNGTYYNNLSSVAKSQIVSANYSIGAVTYNNRDLQDQINDENRTTWSGKVALPTLSEYFRTNSNANCKTFYAYNSTYKICSNSTWMSTTAYSYWWTLSPLGSGSASVYSNGNVNTIDASGTNIVAVRPAITLSSEVQITGGTGTQSNPYTIQ